MIMEAMKMEIAVVAETAGTVVAIHGTAGAGALAGDMLLALRPVQRMTLDLTIATLRARYRRAASSRPRSWSSRCSPSARQFAHTTSGSARSSDAALRARARELDGIDPATLPLYGIPFAIKDNIDFAGLADHGGLPGLRLSTRASAPVVQALLDAGAIALGKTNLDQFATGLVGTRSPYGACRNAFDPRLHQRRLVERLGRGGGARARELRAGHRHRGIGPRAGGVQQPDRLQTHARHC